MKKIVSLIMAFSLLLSQSVFAADFKDVPVGTDIEEAVNLLEALNVAKGISDSEFGVDENVSRQQMAAFIYRMMKAGKSVEGGINTTTFIDLEDPTFYFMISWASSEGIIKGRTETTFDPRGEISLQDAYTMIVRALGYDNGKLTYPIGYISLAEDLGLDKNLPSTLDYTDTLTRGNVAIILANMFYAETTDVEIKYEASWKEVTLSNGEIAVVSNGQVPVEYHKTVAEAIFGVEKVVQRVVATPSYSFDGAIKPDEDVEMIVLKGAGYIKDYAEDYDVPNLTIEFSELGLEGSADDYFLNDIEMFVKEDNGDYEVFSAIATGKSVIVSYEDISFDTISGMTANKYYDEEKEYKIINGKIDIDGVITYIFDAPYSYTKNNAACAEFITLGEYDGDIEEEEIFYNYEKVEVIADEDIVWGDGYLAQAYHDGLGEMTCFDCNGDGKYEYIFNKPYSVLEVDTTEDEAITIDDEYILYSDMTIVEGVNFEDKDIVLGYINYDANYVKVAEVLKPVEAEVITTATKYFTLDTNNKIYYKNIDYPVITNPVTSKDLGTLAFDIVRTYYFAGDKLVKIEGENVAINLDEDWIIALEAEPHIASVMVDGRLQKDYYLDVIKDGEIVSVKVANDDYSDYVNRLATLKKIDKKGRYMLELLPAFESDLTGDNAEAELRVLGVEAEFYHSSGNFYKLGDRRVYIKPYTQIIIKSLDRDGEVVVNTYDSKNLPDIKENTVFTDVSYVLVNNVNSKTYENLAVFYGVLDDEIKPAKNTTNDIRIVKSYEKSKTADEIIYTYALYNPATGEIEENVEGYDETSIAEAGDIVKLTAAGYVDTVVGNINDAGEVYIDEDSVIGYTTIAEYDNDMILFNGDDTMYFITEDTVVNIIDLSDEEISYTRTSNLDPTTRSCWYDKDNDIKEIRVIVSAEENKDDEYEVIYITIIRK